MDSEQPTPINPSERPPSKGPSQKASPRTTGSQPLPEALGDQQERRDAPPIVEPPVSDPSSEMESDLHILMGPPSSRAFADSDPSLFSLTLQVGEQFCPQNPAAEILEDPQQPGSPNPGDAGTAGSNLPVAEGTDCSERPTDSQKGVSHTIWPGLVDDSSPDAAPKSPVSDTASQPWPATERAWRDSEQDHSETRAHPDELTPSRKDGPGGSDPGDAWRESDLDELADPSSGLRQAPQEPLRLSQFQETTPAENQSTWDSGPPETSGDSELRQSPASTQGAPWERAKPVVETALGNQKTAVASSRPGSSLGGDSASSMSVEDLAGADPRARNQRLSAPPVPSPVVPPGGFLDEITEAGNQDNPDRAGQLQSHKQRDEGGLVESTPEDQAGQEQIQRVWGDSLSRASHSGQTLQRNQDGLVQASSLPRSRVYRQTRKIRQVGPMVQCEAEPSQVAWDRLDYELGESLGEGGMGQVFRARQTAVDRELAIKMIHSRVTDKRKLSEMRIRLLAEAVTLGDLEHPNIVPVYDLGVTQQKELFYAMKWVRGESWLSRLERERDQPPADAKERKRRLDQNVDILMRVADALAFAHSRDVVHRDLKPENVMLGEFGEVLLMDWGLATSFGPQGKAFLPGPEGRTGGGTPSYMSPETAQGRKEQYQPTSDIYLLGATLYEIVTGVPPHVGKSPQECLLNAWKNRITTTQEKGELVEIALKAMATRPADRYQTVQDFQEAIRQYQFHSESVVLSDQARVYLEKARPREKPEPFEGDYDGLNRSLAVFREAVAMWEGNASAQRGIAEASLALATVAYRRADLELAHSLLSPREQTHDALRAEVQQAMKDRDSEQRKSRFRKYAFWAALAISFVILSVSVVVFSFQNAIIRNAKQKADQSAQLAEKREKEALDAKDVALNAERKAREALGQAEDARNLADDRRREAVIAQQKEAHQRRVAEVAREREQEEAYVSRIRLGLSEEKKNRFAIVWDLLQQTAKSLPHWEWGWLQRKCHAHLICFRGQAAEGQRPQRVYDIAWHGLTRTLATASADGRIYLWSVDPQTPLSEKIWDHHQAKKSLHHGSAVLGIAFSPKQKYLASVGKEGRLVLWDWATGKKIAEVAASKQKVRSVRFSSEGNQLLTASQDGLVKRWGLNAGGQLVVEGTFTDGDRRPLTTAIFSPDDKWVLTAADDGWVAVYENLTKPEPKENSKSKTPWLYATLQVKKTDPKAGAHQGAVESLCFSPDGKNVITTGADQKTRIWKWKDPASIYDVIEPDATLSEHSAAVRSSTVSPDGRFLLTGSDDNTVRIWDLSTRKTIRILRGHGGWVSSLVAFRDQLAGGSRDQLLVFSGSYDGDVKLWETVNGPSRLTWKCPTEDLRAQFFGDSQVLTAGQDGAVRLYDAQTGRVVRLLSEGHRQPVKKLASTPDGRFALTGDMGGEVYLWSLKHPGGEKGWRVRQADGQLITAVAISEDGATVAVGLKDEVVEIWNTASVKPSVKHYLLREPLKKILLKQLPGWKPDLKGLGIAKKPNTSRTPRALAFAPDGRSLVIAPFQARHGLWVVSALNWSESGRVTVKRLTQRSLTNPVFGLEFNRQATRLTAISAQDGLSQWSFPEGRSLFGRRLSGRPTAWVSSRGRRFTLVGSDLSGGVKSELLELTGTQLTQSNRREEPEFEGSILAIGLSADPQERFAALALQQESQQRNTLLWVDRTNGEPTTLPAPREINNIQHLAVLPGSRLLAAGECKVMVWDRTDEQSPPRPRPLSVAHTGAALAAATSPKNAPPRMVSLGLRDQVCKIWDPTTGELILQFQVDGHGEFVHQVAISPDGQTVATAGSNGSAALWSVKDRRVTFQLPKHNAAVRDIQFSPDGQFVLTAGADQTVRLCHADSGEEVDLLDGGQIRGEALVARPYFVQERLQILIGTSQGDVGLWRPLLSAADASLVGAVENSEQSSFRRFAAHPGTPINAVDLSQDGRRILTASDDRTVKLWQVMSSVQEAVSHPESAADLPPRTDAPAAVDPSDAGKPRGRSAAGETLGRLQRELTTPKGNLEKIDAKELLTLHTFDTVATTAAFSPNELLVLAASRGGEVVILQADPWPKTSAPPKPSSPHKPLDEDQGNSSKDDRK